VTGTTLAINRMLAARYGNGGDVTYLDVGHVFVRDGKLDRDLFLDPKLTPPEPPLHPSAEGQRRMAEAIEPALVSLLGDRSRKP
jgi:lysophospholipase L1-like esterase